LHGSDLFEDSNFGGNDESGGKKKGSFRPSNFSAVINFHRMPTFCRIVICMGVSVHYVWAFFFSESQGRLFTNTVYVPSPRPLSLCFDLFYPPSSAQPARFIRSLTLTAA
jgi:hypothetical protein